MTENLVMAKDGEGNIGKPCTEARQNEGMKVEDLKWWT